MIWPLAALGIGAVWLARWVNRNRGQLRIDRRAQRNRRRQVKAFRKEQG